MEGYDLKYYLKYDFNVGDTIGITTPDLTIWNRFLHWLIRRPIPTKMEVFEVVKVNSDIEFEIK